MKVAFVTPAYYPAVIGASFYCQTLAKELVGRGFDVEVYTNAPASYKKEDVVDGIKVRRFYPKIAGSYYISRGMLTSLIRGKFDIIHSHHYGYFPATAGFMAAKLRNTPHAFGPYYHPPIYGIKKSIMSGAYHLTQGLPILRFSDIVLPHTEFEKNALLKAGGREDNMKILPNTVDTKRFHPGKKEKIVLFVSNLLKEKGADVAFGIAERILSRRRDTRFVFIGNPVDRSLHARITKLKKNKNVTFLKNISLGELVKWYQKSLIFILPSMYEAFARVVAEAEACGCAIVATRVGGIPEVVNSKAGFLVDHGEWDKMEERIEYLLDNPDATRKMGIQGRKYVEENFDSDVVVKKLVGIYENMVRT
ncbi:glycosyltransferase family 4 protein [Candidatus Woesearchaeota archaeon]|nr:glycosyltransferase family 4 protein [Candidatus Woesearchaeota archaeon]